MEWRGTRGCRKTKEPGLVHSLAVPSANKHGAWSELTSKVTSVYPRCVNVKGALVGALVGASFTHPHTEHWVPQNDLDARQRPTMIPTIQGWKSSRQMNPTRKEIGAWGHSSAPWCPHFLPYYTPVTACANPYTSKLCCAGRNQDGTARRSSVPAP